MTIRSDSVTNRDRKSELGMWLTNHYFMNISKTICHVDYYHKHLQRILVERKASEGKNMSSFYSLYNVYFNPTLLSTPNLRIIPLANPAHAHGVWIRLTVYR